MKLPTQNLLRFLAPALVLSTPLGAAWGTPGTGGPPQEASLRQETGSGPSPRDAAEGDAGVPESAPSSLTKERARVLHHAGGELLRARSHWNGTAWEVKRGSDWTALPPGSVVRAVDEKDLFAEVRRRKAARSDAEGRAALAEWMHSEGLVAESLATLDDVLEGEPDQARALAFLRDLGMPLRLPSPVDERDAYLRTACGLPPAARELAVRGLLRVSDPHELRASLEAELAAGSPRRRAFGALALRRLFPGQALEPLLGRAVLDPSQDVRHEAARALRDTGDEAVAAPVLRVLGSEHGALREHAAEALGVMGYTAAVPTLVEHLATLSTAAASSGGWRAPAANLFVGRQRAYIQDFDVEVAQGASIADPTVGTLVEGNVLDVRVLGITGAGVATERAAVRRALTRLTGAEPGHTTRAWSRWWESEGEAWYRAARPHTPER